MVVTNKELNVILLDDVEEVRQAIQSTLLGSGYLVDAADSLRSFATQLSENQYDVAIIDIEIGTDYTPEEALQEFVSNVKTHIRSEQRLEILSVLAGLSRGDGRAVLAIMNTLFPRVHLVVLTGKHIDIDSFQEFKKLGAFEAVAKGFIDESPKSGDLPGAESELLGVLEEIQTVIEIGVADPVKGELQIELEKLPPFEEILGKYRGEYNLQAFLISHVKYWHERFEVGAEILYLNQEQKILEQVATVGIDRHENEMVLRKLASNGFEQKGLCGFAAATGKSVLVQEVKYDIRYAPVRSGITTCSELVVPLVLGGKVIGILNLESSRPYAFENHHLEYFDRISPIIALLLEHETYRNEEKFLSRAMDAVQGQTSLTSIYEMGLQQILRVLGVNTFGAVFAPYKVKGETKGLKVLVNIGLDLEVGSTYELARFGVISSALESNKGRKYWSIDQGTSGYVPLREDIQSEYALASYIGGSLVAVVDIESTRAAISERYQRVIERIVERLTGLTHKIEATSTRGGLEVLEQAKAALSYETHNLKGSLIALSMKAQKLGNGSQTSSLVNALASRLDQTSRILDSYFAPETDVDLVAVLEETSKRAERLGIKFSKDIPDNSATRVRGTYAGVLWVFENLLNNSSKHAIRKSEPLRAGVQIEATPDCIKGTYWDDGKYQQEFKYILESSHEGQGLRDISNLCQRYGWKVAAKDRAGAGLCLEFVFPRGTESTF